MTSDVLIKQLSEDLRPVKPIAHPLKRATAFAVLSFAYIGLCVLFLGERPDLSEVFSDTAFLFEVAVMSVVALGGILASSWLMVPDMRGQRWLKLIAPVALAFFALWIALRSIAEGASIPQFHWDHCFTDGLLMAAFPACVLTLITMRGKTTAPVALGVYNAVTVAGLGYVGLRMTCMLDTVGHATLYHLVPFILLGMIIAALAKFIFRW